ncbi:MAG: HlyD family efflux transporter periplasmic adaptor subunit [Rhizobium sp.]|jgi:membrane fusion protein (multidrug efflux system)|uniref:HlyD family secretion protein n=1 Tax=Thiobacillus sp. TaxID=924 RepID=UPI0025CC3CFD|nr:HlyD family efflux transporter periplasmic adaptor subunit [Thiobacillus sp.]MBW8366022.1 HlyD family efflux transporter periplasmic adaptor subunit [Rhizobium sp.]
MTIDPPEANPAKRKRLLTMLALIFLIAGTIWGVRWFLYSRGHESTDDAYVAGNLVRATPRVAGSVVAVLADDTDFVKQGQVVVKLDDTDARLALAKAEADLGEIVRRISQTFEAHAQQTANLAVKQRTLEQAEADLVRRERAVAVDAISREEAEHARAARDKARSELDLARAQLAASKAEVGGTSVATHPAVKQAEARLREAWLALNRCEIRAPSDGQVAKRSVQIGQQVAPGMALMAIVPMTQLWVEANFKEDQLKGMHIGQPVQLVSDLYGSGTIFHGTVAGLSPGTGSVFSLLPAQNASGNWIKIVQRLPVRITLDTKELAEHPLRVGLSMKVEVETAAAGKADSHPATRYVMPVEDAAGADALIRSILRANQVHTG